MPTTQPASSGVKARSFAVDGAGWVVALDTGGRLVHFAPGSTTPLPLGSGITSFGVDDAGSVVELTSGGALNLLAPGPSSNPPLQLATGVSELVVDTTNGCVYWLSGGVLTRRQHSNLDSLDSGVQSFSLSPDGTLAVVYSSWQYNTLTRGLVNPSNAPIPRSLLACVGEVDTPNDFGSGTLLDAGANYIVLTAWHVVKGADPSNITFKLTSGSGFDTVATYTVRKVIPNVGLDLALLVLTQQVQHVLGAFIAGYWELPADAGQQVIQVGYGETNNGSQQQELYGFNWVAQVSAPYLVYNYQGGQSATAPGDSGGPDLAWVTRTNRVDGSTVYIPVILGVQDMGPQGGPPYSPGDQTYSVAITRDVATWIYNHASPFA
jgi:hypothetical protein